MGFCLIANVHHVRLTSLVKMRQSLQIVGAGRCWCWRRHDESGGWLKTASIIAGIASSFLRLLYASVPLFHPQEHNQEIVYAGCSSQIALTICCRDTDVRSVADGSCSAGERCPEFTNAGRY